MREIVFIFLLLSVLDMTATGNNSRCCATSNDSICQISDKIDEKEDSITTKELEEVIIRGNNEFVRLKGTRLSIDLTHSPLGQLPSTEDVLSQLPFVKGSDQSYSVMGRGKAVIFLGNRKIQDYSELSRIHPSEIKSVEIIRNPGVEYDAEYKAVIKIILKKNLTDGLGIRAYTRESMGRRLSDYQQLWISYNTERIKLFLTTDNDSYRTRSDQTNNETFYTPSHIWDMNVDMDRWNAEFYNWSLSGGCAINFHPRHSTGAKLTYSNDTRRNSGTGETGIIRDGNQYELLITDNSNPQHYNQWQGNLYYDGQISDKCTININADYVNRQSLTNKFTMEEGTFTSLHGVREYTSSQYNLYSGIAKLDWVLSEKVRINLGMDGSIIRQFRKFNTTTSDGESLLKSTESKIALFARSSLNLWKYELSGGVRLERDHLYYAEGLENKSPLLNKNYFRMYPELSLSATFGPVNMSFGFSSRVRRPSFYQLRSGSEYFNRYITVMGNPLLLPSYIYEISYSIQYQGLIANLGWGWVQNPFGEETIVKSDNPLLLIHRPINIKCYRVFTAGCIYNYKFSFWRGNISGNLTKTLYDIPRDYDSMPKMKTSPYIELALSNYFSFAGTTAYVNINYNPPGTYCNERIGNYTGIDLGIFRRFLNKNLYIAFKFANILGSKSKSKSYERMYIFERIRYQDTKRVVLTVSYSFRHKNPYKVNDSAHEEILRM